MTYSNFTTAVNCFTSSNCSVLVTNTGPVAAAQTTMLFSRVLNASSVPDAPLPLPNRQLFDFERTPTLAPGESATLEFSVDAAAVALVDWSGARMAFAGDYVIEFFSGSKSPDATEKHTVETTITLSTIPAP